jgi:branched-chain amino acid transport system substrate-binding protein
LPRRGWKERNLKKACTLYQDDDFGLEVMRGAEAGLKVIGLQIVEKTSYKRGATDFSSQVAQHEGRGLRPGGAGHHHPRDRGHHGRGAQDRLFARFRGLQRRVHRPDPQAGRQGHGRPVRHHDAVAAPLPGRRHPAIRFWANKYKTRFNEDPSVFSVYGYGNIDNFIKVAFKVGPNLSTDSFVKTLDNMSFPRDMFGTAEMTLPLPSGWATSSHACRRSRTAAGRWCLTMWRSGLKAVMQKNGKFVGRVRILPGLNRLVKYASLTPMANVARMLTARLTGRSDQQGDKE